jgi:heptaprenylglyceryl phosphate synthase
MVAADLSGKTWMAIGETDDPNAVIESFAVAAAVTKGDPVYLSASETVTSAAAAQDCIGVAVKTQTTVGGQVPVLTKGRVKVKAGAAITLGKAVYGADATKRVLELADVSQAVDEGGAAKYTIAAYYNRKLGYACQAALEANDLIFIKVGK